MTEPRPAWADSVAAFASASNRSSLVNSAPPIQFPDTGQLGGVCGNLLGGSAMTNGLMAAGDPNQGTAGSLVSGTQFFSDMFCGLMGGAGTDTSPQQIAAAGQDVSTAVNTTPMSSGTIAMGGSSGNTALDAINGVQNLANNLYSILAGCGCAPALSPDGVGPEQIINTSQDTADAVNNSPFASGIIGMGQDPTGSGNVAVDAINGTQNFANGLFNLMRLCGCGSAGVAPTRSLLPRGLPPGPLVMRVDTNPYSPNNADPQTILDVASAIAGAVHGNPFAQDLLGGGSGNIAIDALTSGQALANNVHKAVSGTVRNASLQDVAAAGSQAINQNTANHAGHVSLTTAQSVNLLNQNLLVSQDFSSATTVVGDTNWSWDGTDNAPGTNVLGCAKVVCDGTQNPLVSNEIPVVTGETIEVACELKWSGLTYTGASPLILAVEKYRLMKDPAGSGHNVYTDIGWYDVITIPSPAASSGWKGIAGKYVVEPGVDQLRFRLDPAKSVTAGEVKWDAAEFLKTDLIAAECVPATGQTVDTIVTQLYGAQGSGFTQNDAAVALGNTAAALATVSQKVGQLEAEGGTGAIAADDFNWSGPIASNSNWRSSYLHIPNSGGGLFTPNYYGWYSANGADLVWNSLGQSQAGLFAWAGTDAASTGDYQVIQLVLGSAFQTAAPFPSWIDLLGRVSTGAFTSYVYARINFRGGYIIGYGSGFETEPAQGVMASGTVTVPGQGSTITLYLGDKASSAPRHFKLKINTTTIAEFDEVGTSSPLGSSHRGWGFGAFTYSNVFAAEPAPPKISQWMAQDQ